MQKRSEEAYKEWSELSNEAMRSRFEDYATAFYRVYSPKDGHFTGSKESLKALDALLNKDLGFYRVHSFLSTWSPLGLTYKSQPPTNDLDEWLQRLDTLYRKCLLYLRENKQYSDELLVLSGKGKEAVTSHAFEVLSNKQKARAIGISNTLKEAQWLNKKLPKGGDVLTSSKGYISKIRSELQKINTKVEQLNNALKLLGLEVEELADTRTSFAISKGSEEILEADYNFPSLSVLKTNSEVDPHFSQLFDMFIEDFRNTQSVLSKSEEDKRYPMFTEEYLSTIHNVRKDVDRLSPLSSISKITKKGGGDPSSMLDYEKIGHDTASLPDDLDKRFKDLSRWRGWVQLPPAKPVTLPRTATLEPRPDREREQRNTQEQLNRISYSQPSSEDIRVAIDPEGRRRILKGDEQPRTNERLDLVEERCVHIPCMDTGDVFNGTMGKKRRIFKVSVRVINTAGIEVGILGYPLIPVEELRGEPKTGEFEVLVPSDASVNPEIVISQKTGTPFCLTSITAHMQIEN
ncbi:hypothetical protein KP07_05305 [Candidatus Liberibacter solanacearum]|nr:hypothetical protein [Candidatus Liberibacter solanacearum]KJZ80678.1 hypothetical protein KP07_05305 [Candidatus Liberibacter solanacearum]